MAVKSKGKIVYCYPECKLEILEHLGDQKERYEKELRENIAIAIENFHLLSHDDTTQEEINIFNAMRKAAAQIARGSIA